MKARLLSLAALIALARTLPAATNLFDVVSVEGRYGIGDTYTGEGFHNAAVAADFSLATRWELGRDWSLTPRLSLSGGWLGNASQDAGFIALGPMLVLGKAGFPLTVEAGVSPTLLSESVFGGRNIGGCFQFTDSIGATCGLSARWQAGYHFVHLSNAGLYNSNPGINLHVFSVGYRF